MMFKQLSSPPPVKPATREEAFEFLRGLQEFRRRGDKPIDEKAIRDYLHRQSVGSLQSISSRILMDILKSPTADSKRDPRQKGKRKKKRTAPKPAAAKKRKTAGRKAPKKKVSRKR